MPRVAALLRLTAVAACAALIAACAGPSSPRPAFYQDLARAGSQLDAAKARDMINSYRKAQGLGEVSLNPALMSLAKGYAASLAAAARSDRNVKPDGQLKARLQSAGYSAADVSESVTAGYHTFAEAFSGWRDSTPHRKTMLMPNAADMGIAAAYAPSTRYKVYWVLVMAKPN